MIDTPPPNVTATTFGYPATVVHAYRHWLVQVRPHQCTLGALILLCSDRAKSFSQIDPAAFTELQTVTADIETGLTAFRSFKKLNYLMLMMKDPDVHFHVLPRYDTDQTFAGLDFHDAGWPAVPNLSGGHKLVSGRLAELVGELQAAWPSQS